jgi:hypothetical protein
MAKAARLEYKEIKQQKSQLKRRMKIIKSNWRNGVVGVEGPEDEQGPLF